MKIPLQGCLKLQKNSQYGGYYLTTSTHLKRNNHQECFDFLIFFKQRNISFFSLQVDTRILEDVKMKKKTK